MITAETSDTLQNNNKYTIRHQYNCSKGARSGIEDMGWQPCFKYSLCLAAYILIWWWWLVCVCVCVCECWGCGHSGDILGIYYLWPGVCSVSRNLPKLMYIPASTFIFKEVSGCYIKCITAVSPQRYTCLMARPFHLPDRLHVSKNNLGKPHLEWRSVKLHNYSLFSPSGSSDSLLQSEQ